VPSDDFHSVVDEGEDEEVQGQALSVRSLSHTIMLPTATLSAFPINNGTASSLDSYVLPRISRYTVLPVFLILAVFVALWILDATFGEVRTRNKTLLEFRYI
jgi:hypothetical protein